jgi:GTP-binding protein
MSNVVAIVGRPNVGKSTFFNRLIGHRQAIMDNQSGVTRDRHYGYSEWIGKNFTVVDTGGYVEGSDDVFEGQIRRQVQIALEEADVVVFMVDLTDGLTELDKDFANIVRRSKKPVIVAANKVDYSYKEQYTGEFYALGLGEIFEISANTGTGTGELLDEVVKYIKSEQEENPDEGIPRIAIVGRPNVGKSSITNVLLGEERNIVTDIAGTTRDSIDTRYSAFGHDLILTDTAGIRRKSKIRDEQIEFYSVLRTMKAIENSDVVMVVMDATRGIESQDVQIVQMAIQNRKGVVILVNKWDAFADKDQKSAQVFEQAIRDRMPLQSYIPVVFVSAHTKQRILKAIEVMIEVYENRRRRISTSQLNDVMLEVIKATPPPSVKAKMVKIKYITQLPVYYPVFAFYCNLPQYVVESYQRFLENRLRENFQLSGVPVSLVFKKK